MNVYIVWFEYDNGELYEEHNHHSGIIKIFKNREEAVSFITALTSDELLSLYEVPCQFSYESSIEKQSDFDRDEYDYWENAECIFFRQAEEEYGGCLGANEAWAISIREMEVEE